MADHLITGTITYAIFMCGNGRCGHVWEQRSWNLDMDAPGWHVCPECFWAAPTNVAREVREA